MKIASFVLVAFVVGSGGCGGHSPGDQPDAACLDMDGDGITTCAGDCDDGDAATFPGSVEICGGRVSATLMTWLAVELLPQ